MEDNRSRATFPSREQMKAAPVTALIARITGTSPKPETVWEFLDEYGTEILNAEIPRSRWGMQPPAAWLETMLGLYGLNQVFLMAVTVPGEVPGRKGADDEAVLLPEVSENPALYRRSVLMGSEELRKLTSQNPPPDRETVCRLLVDQMAEWHHELEVLGHD